jgi:GxxExxY protein
MGEEKKHRFEDLTRTIIGCAFNVSNDLGCGFLEKVYENSLAVEFRQKNIPFGAQVPLRVLYSGQTVGEYVADMIVDSSVLVEIKATEIDNPAHKAQVINYLRATGLEVGLLLNFGRPRLSVQRLVRSHNYFIKTGVPLEHTGHALDVEGEL